MTKYRSDLPPRPERMRKLPIDARGFPVPWFVAWLPDQESGIDKPDFRVVRPNGVGIAYTHRLCWLCGERLGRFAAFVVGPMCGINRSSSEPPSHRSCAAYAVKACPFLTRPLATRNTRNLPEGTVDPAGIMLPRNPRVSLLWATDQWESFWAGDGYLIRMGDPSVLQFWSQGRKATLEEIKESVAGGMSVLMELAKRDGEEGVRELGWQVHRFNNLVAEAYPCD